MPGTHERLPLKRDTTRCTVRAEAGAAAAAVAAAALRKPHDCASATVAGYTCSPDQLAASSTSNRAVQPHINAAIRNCRDTTNALPGRRGGSAAPLRAIPWLTTPFRNS